MGAPVPLSTASDAAIGALLLRWAPQQRWFAHKGATVVLERVERTLLDEGGVAQLVALTVRTGPQAVPSTYSVPLTVRHAPDASLEHALVGRLPDVDGAPAWLYDGPHDPTFTRALLTLVAAEEGAGSATFGVSGASADGGLPVPVAARTRVLGGEQSNTSVVVAADEGETPLIAKVFRVLAAGDNPDVVVQTVLAEAGCTRVPRPAGWVDGQWTAPDGSRASGHLAHLTEFLAGSQDAWRVATAAVAAGEPFAAQARELGRATAEVHAVLAAELPVEPADGTRLAALADGLLARVDWAVDAVPQLADVAAAARERVDAVRGATGAPALQRVHGDYHLGQVLHSPERGWVLLDFEGEPLRPLAERSLPDLALRDVAGMLRSFDYAASTAPGGARDAAARAWERECRAAFLDGYAEVSAEGDPRRAGSAAALLLAALELDKALYEVVYEARNRPDWLPIPLDAVHRLVAAPGARGTTDDERLTPVPTDPTPFPPLPASHDDLARTASGAHWSPHSVLGVHPHDGGVTYRVLKPFATSVVVLTEDGARVELTHEHEGVWVGARAGAAVGDYRVEVTYSDGATHVHDDAYRFLPTVGEVDLHLVNEGRHEQLWTVLGAHVRHWEGPLGPVDGTSFAVWAPNAQAVRVVGDHNHWDGRTAGMRTLGSSGVWEVFLPGVGAGTRYKYEILGADGQWRQKADPLAQATEVPPAQASVVTESSYAWGDDAWLERRAASDPHAGPVSVYEVHLGSWRQGLGYRELATELVDYVRDTGFTHVELLPVMEHPFGGSWGYQVSSYFAPTSRFGSPDEFRHLVDALHQAGIGVIIDWVPGHFPKDAFALGRFDGTALYEHADPRRGEQMDWGTYVFDFGRSEVRNFLVASGLYWLEEFHADGLRVDAVASMLYLDYSREEGQWVPNVHGGRENLEAIAFLQEANATAYKRTPGIMMIAEESTAFPGVTAPTDAGGLGFGLKWNMGWMHDTLQYAAEDPVHRRYHHGELTFSLVYAFTENFCLPISHDEVVHGKGSLLRKMPGDRWQQLANVRAYLAYMWSHPGKQLLFMGSELGQEAEWSESRSLDWWLLDTPWHRGLQQLVRSLNAVYKDRPELWSQDFSPAGFSWIDGGDAERNLVSFVRWSTDGKPLVAVANFSGSPYEDFRVGLPRGGSWRELLNTDAEEFAGSGVVNPGALAAEDVAWNGQESSLVLRVPPLGVTWLVPQD